MRFIATCKMGLESTVSRQLRDMGIRVDAVSDARISFSGGADELARALLWLRTAERVLLVISQFRAVTFSELFDGASEVDWTRYLERDSFIHVTGKSAKSTLFSVSDCQSIVKKAIVERIKKKYRCVSLPETGREVIVEVGILRDEVTLALDACGAGLSRRGYRTYNVAAPISETLAAAVVLLSRYCAERPFIDPMCGSGTLPIEACMSAQNRAPGLNRDFAAENWKFIDQGVFSKAREEARESILDIPVEILGSDIDPRCIDVCKKHAKKAGVMTKWKVAPLSEFKAEGDRGVICCNPPYGERLMDRREIVPLYREMGERFTHLSGWSVNIISAAKDFERLYGRQADKTRKLSNGGMTCRLYQYFRG